MRTCFSVLLTVAFTASAFGDGDSDRDQAKEHGPRSALFGEELETILMEVRGREIGSLTVGEFESLLDEISILQQKAAFIQKARGASFMMPGVGQLMNGNTLGGVLLLFADVAIFAASVTTAYFLLPEELRFDQLDYFNASQATIKERWQAQSFSQMLPAKGVMAGMMVAEMLLRVFASKNAAGLAQQNILAGKITFEPSLGRLAFRLGK